LLDITAELINCHFSLFHMVSENGGHHVFKISLYWGQYNILLQN